MQSPTDRVSEGQVLEDPPDPVLKHTLHHHTMFADVGTEGFL